MAAAHPDCAFRYNVKYFVYDNPNSRENVMRATLQRLLGKPFAKVRPPFLRNPATNHCLELDAYNAELRLAAEFQGEQHRVWPNCFHDTREQFEAQQQRDELKAKLCKQNGVTLILVLDHITRDEIDAFLQAELQRIGFLKTTSPVESK